MMKIKFAKIKPKNTLEEQRHKIFEELVEVDEILFFDDDFDQERLEDELFDIMQACVSFLVKLESDIEAINKRHLKKIENYVKTGRIKLDNN